ncbi:Hypothetical protein CINCED_3A015161 [Cinara cedri]|uniref:Uncharacterized protein n=1 Tax=Cinara cedri TaxID=506608 RepID=A0A5E4NIE6_9HEMI|nr:Hypothetical protein CINCED_3A015161 [Cinara cedri]
MDELLKNILECIEFVSDYATADLAEITETWDRCSQTHSGLVEKINLTWRVSLEADFLEEFPDIRTKLAKKLERFSNEQLSVLHSLIKRVSCKNESLKTKLEKINNRLEQISFEEHNELKHSVREHVIWIENCWMSFHCLYLQIEFAMMSLQVLDEESACNLVDAIKQSEEHKLTLRKSHSYTQSCLSLIKFVENKSKIKINV